MQIALLADTPKPDSPARIPQLAGQLSDWLPAGLSKVRETQPLLFFCLYTGVLIGLFVALARWFPSAAALSSEGYAQPWLVIALATQLGGPLLVGLLVLTLLLLRGALTSRWSALETGSQMRWFVVFLAALMTWPLVTLGYNYYFDQAYLFDRGLLLGLLVLVWLRPGFIFPFLLLAFTLMGQLKEPDLGGSILAHKLQVLNVLLMFASAFLVHAITGSRRSDGFWFLSGCLVAGAYWEAALAKLQLGWLDYGHLDNILPASYAHGWLGFLDPETIVTFARALAPFDHAMGLSVLIIEVGCLLFLWRRRLSLVLLVLVILFHLGVFVLFGFLFWTWMLLDAALLVVLLRDLRTRAIPIYSRGHLLLSVVLIASIGLWAKPPHLGWFDTRLSYTYKYQAITADGSQYTLPPRFFEPYADAFVLAPFNYLVRQHPVLTGSYGVTMNRERADVVQAAGSAEQIFAAEARYGTTRYRPALEARFHRFLVHYLSHRNARGEELAWLTALQAPAQLWSYPHGKVYRGQEPIRELVISEVTTLYDGQHLVPIRSIEIARLDIPDASPATTR